MTKQTREVIARTEGAQGMKGSVWKWKKKQTKFQALPEPNNASTVRKTDWNSEKGLSKPESEYSSQQSRGAVCWVKIVFQNFERFKNDPNMFSIAAVCIPPIAVTATELLQSDWRNYIVNLTPMQCRTWGFPGQSVSLAPQLQSCASWNVRFGPALFPSQTCTCYCVFENHYKLSEWVSLLVAIFSVVHFKANGRSRENSMRWKCKLESNFTASSSGHCWKRVCRPLTKS